MAFRAPQATTETLALVLGRTLYGDADLIVQLFTEEHGRLSALARGARKSQKRFGGSLEPMHTMNVEMVPTSRSELHTLRGSHIHQARPLLLSHLKLMTAAGRTLSWTKRATSAHVVEPLLWASLNQTLDQLAQSDPDDADDLTAGFGLRLLELMGWGINFLRCVSCGKNCPEQRPAWLNPERGGLVCRSCGGGPFQVAGIDRLALHRVAQGADAKTPHAAAALTIKIVERALGAHMGWEDGGGIQDLGKRKKS